MDCMFTLSNNNLEDDIRYWLRNCEIRKNFPLNSFPPFSSLSSIHSPTAGNSVMGSCRTSRDEEATSSWPGEVSRLLPSSLWLLSCELSCQRDEDEEMMEDFAFQAGQ